MNLKKKAAVVFMALATIAGVTIAAPTQAFAATNTSCASSKPNTISWNGSSTTWDFGGLCTNVIISQNGATVTRRLIFQSDGNFVLYNQRYSGGKALWSSGTYGQAAGVNIRLQNDGNVVIHPKTGNYIWQSHTAGSELKKSFNSSTKFTLNYAFGFHYLNTGTYASRPSSVTTYIDFNANGVNDGYIAAVTTPLSYPV